MLQWKWRWCEDVMELWYIWDNMYNIFNDAFWGLLMIGLSPMTRMQKCVECKFNSLRNTLNCGDIALGTYYFERFFYMILCGGANFYGRFCTCKRKTPWLKKYNFWSGFRLFMEKSKGNQKFSRKWEKNSQTKHGKVNKTYQYLLKKTLYPIYGSMGLNLHLPMRGSFSGGGWVW